MSPENVEFIALVKAAGWSPAEAARRLDLTRSATSRYMQGEIKPSAPVLKLLKLIIANEQPGALTSASQLNEEALAKWEREVVEDLRWLHVEDRERVINVMRVVIRGLPKREAVSYGKAAKTGEKISKAGQEAVRMLMEGTQKPSHHQK